MSNPEAFCATVFYTDKDGAQHTIKALVFAVDVEDAMRAALDAVSSLPACKDILGGILEPAGDDVLDAVHKDLAAMAETANAQRAPGATLH